MQDSKFADIGFSDFCRFALKISVDKVAIDQEELHGIEIDGILNILEQCLSIKNVGI